MSMSSLCQLVDFLTNLKINIVITLEYPMVDIQKEKLIQCLSLIDQALDLVYDIEKSIDSSPKVNFGDLAVIIREIFKSIYDL